MAGLRLAGGRHVAMRPVCFSILDARPLSRRPPKCSRLLCVENGQLSKCDCFSPRPTSAPATPLVWQMVVGTQMCLNAEADSCGHLSSHSRRRMCTIRTFPPVQPFNFLIPAALHIRAQSTTLAYAGVPVAGRTNSTRAPAMGWSSS